VIDQVSGLRRLTAVHGIHATALNDTTSTAGVSDVLAVRMSEVDGLVLEQRVSV